MLKGLAELKPVMLKRGGPNWVRRLNVLFRLAHIDLGLLDNDAFENFLDDLHLALYATERDREEKNPDKNFNQIATRESIREAQRGLDRAIRQEDSPPVIFKLAEQELLLYESKEVGFYSFISCDDLPTLVYMAFRHLLEASDVRRSDFRLCGNEKCGYPFVPLRKPREGSPSYCSPRCANLVAMRNYRKRQTEAKRKEERERSHKKYKTRVEAKRGRPTRVQRRPRKAT